MIFLREKALIQKKNGTRTRETLTNKKLKSQISAYLIDFDVCLVLSLSLSIAHLLRVSVFKYLSQCMNGGYLWHLFSAIRFIYFFSCFVCFWLLFESLSFPFFFSFYFILFLFYFTSFHLVYQWLFFSFDCYTNLYLIEKKKQDKILNLK